MQAADTTSECIAGSFFYKKRSQLFYKKIICDNDNKDAVNFDVIFIPGDININ